MNEVILRGGDSPRINAGELDIGEYAIRKPDDVPCMRTASGLLWLETGQYATHTTGTYSVRRLLPGEEIVIRRKL
jgi:hypothetical protein